MKKPKRVYEITIHLSADSAKDIRGALRSIDLEFDRGGPRDMVSGGVDSGWTIECENNPEQTSEKFHEELEIYIAETRRVPRSRIGG